MARPPIKKRKYEEPEPGESEAHEKSETTAYEKGEKQDKALHKAVGKIGKKLNVKMSKRALAED